MKIKWKILFCFVLLRIHGIFPLQENGEVDYVDFESAVFTEHFQLENEKPLSFKAKDQYCMEKISAAVLPAAVYGGNQHYSYYYVKIQWISKNSMMSIKMESNSLNDSYCEAENKLYYNRKPFNQSFHVFPDDVNEGFRYFPIKLDCKYIITPELEGMCRQIKFDYKTPVCIDNVTCTCRNVSFPLPNFQARLEKNGISVLWTFSNDFETKDLISFIIIIYREDGINCCEKVAEKEITMRNWNESKERTAKRKGEEYFPMEIATGDNYRIQGFFRNEINCNGNSTFFSLLRYPDLMEQFYLKKIASIAIISAFVFALVGSSLLLFRKKRPKLTWPKLSGRKSIRGISVDFHSEYRGRKSFLLPPMVDNNSYSNQCSNSYWFDYEDLFILREIGNGNFGVVFYATSTKEIKGTREFAVKQLKNAASADDEADFMEEINTFKLLGSHPNIVKMLGYCEAPHPLSIIMEYVPFNLLKYLKNLRSEFEVRQTTDSKSSVLYSQLSHFRSCSTFDEDYISQSEVESVPQRDRPSNRSEIECSLDNRDLEVFGLQVARGMSHLESRAIIHRDLAARNILMDSRKNLKISDFGMSRTGIYVNKSTRKFPLRWMSPEALINRTYSNKSDVWSFGVVLWEIGTLGGHLEKPENATDPLYDVMVECWSPSPEKRPTFQDLVKKLEDFCQKNHGYVDFSTLRSNYVFPPMEEDYRSSHFSTSMVHALKPDS